MAGPKRTDLFARLADLSEEAVQRLSDAPGADKVLGGLNTLKERTDDLQKRVRGLEKRLAAVEAKVEKLSKGTSSRASSTRKSTKAASTKSSSGAAAKKS